MTKIAIIDYGAGNLLSLTRAIETVGGTPRIVEVASEIGEVDAIILPGVGAAGSAMEALHERGFDQVLRARKRPLLGVCLGMQLFFGHHEESDCDGLGLVRGTVKRMTPTTDAKIPHMGWNRVTWDEPMPLFEGVESGAPFYFVHSYACIPESDEIHTAWTDHAGPVCAAMTGQQIWGVQFHPEKSGDAGLRLLRNFLTLVEGSQP